MPTNAGVGFGVTFAIGDGAPTQIFTLVPELEDIDLPEVSRDSKEATNHGSAERYREHIPGLRDGGEVGLVFNFSEAAYAALMASFGTNTNGDFKITAPTNGAQTTGSSTVVRGHLTSVKPTAPEDDVRKINAKLKVSGKPTYTPGS